MTTADPITGPKYSQTRDALAAEIRRGDLKAGDQLPSVKELIARFRVSYATVSRALAELEQAGLIHRQWGRGTFVCPPQAPAINIAVAFDQRYSPTHPALVQVIRGISTEADQRDLHVQLFPLPHASIFGGESELLLVKLLRSREIAGLIGTGPHPVEDVQQLCGMGVPMVSINHDYAGLSTGAVTYDAVHHAAEIIDHLHGLSHRRIALILGPPPTHRVRLTRASALLGEAILQRMQHHGLPRPAAWTAYSDYDWAAVADQVRGWLTAPADERPTAVVCIEDPLASSTVDLARELGLDVPRDLSVVGINDTLAHLEMTSLRLPFEQMGREAIRMIHELINGGRPQTIQLRGDLHRRRTTERCRGARATESAMSEPG